MTGTAATPNTSTRLPLGGAAMPHSAPGEDRSAYESDQLVDGLKSMEPDPLFAGIAGAAFGAGRIGRPNLVSRSAKGQMIVVPAIAALSGLSHAASTKAINEVSEKVGLPSLVPYSALGLGGIAAFTAHMHMRLPPLATSALQLGGMIGMLVGGTGTALGVADAFRGHEDLGIIDTAAKAIPVGIAAALTVGAIKGGYRNDAAIVPTRVIDQMKDAFAAVRSGPTLPTPHVQQGPAAMERYDTATAPIKQFLDDTTPAESIRRVWGDDAVIGTPKRIMAPLDSGKTAQERVAWALGAAERDGVFEPGAVDQVMIGASTGTGLFQHAFAQSFEMLGKGRTAILGTQYSNKSSFLSKGKVPLQSEQLAGLIEGAAARIKAMPVGTRPELMISSESMGSWTSQNAVAKLMGIDLADESLKSLDQVAGLKSLRDIGVERALWAGTPADSRFRKLILEHEAAKPLEQRTAIEVEKIEDFEALPQAVRDNVQMVFLTHGNDAIPMFGFNALFKRPAAFGGHRPESVREDARYLPVATAFDMVIDEAVGPAMAHRQMTATGHAYQASFPALARELYVPHGTMDDAAFTRMQRELARLELRRHPDPVA